MESNILKLMGTAIKEFRKSKKLTQRELADSLNISTRQIQNIEQFLNLPSIDLLYRMHIKYGFSIDSAFDLENSPLHPRIQELAYRLNKYSPEEIEKIVKLFEDNLNLL